MMKRNHEVQTAYSGLLVNLCSSYIERNVNPGLIKLSMKGYVQKLIYESTSTHDPQGWLYRDLSTAKTAIDVFDVISMHTSWFNFLLLETVVENTGCSNEKSLLEAYIDDELVPYLECSIFEIPSKATSSDSVSLYLKLSDDIQLTGNNVRTLQKKLEELLHVPSLEFDSVSEGCVQLMFSIPRALFECYPDKSSLHRYIVWEETVKAYRITADIAQIL